MAVTMNRVQLAGNLTRDPELRFTSSGIPVCQFGLAVNERRGKGENATERVHYFDINVWRDQGEAVANYKKKGDPVLVEGRLQYSSWEAQDGSKRSKVDVVADNVQFLYRRPEGENGSGSNGSANGEGQKVGAGAGQGDDLNEEDFDDIPF